MKAVKILAEANVDFVIIGGWCAILHGSAYITNDLDVCFSRDKQNCERIVRALAPFHPRLRDLPTNLSFIWDATSLKNASILTLSTDLGPIDLLAEVSGLGSFADVKKKSILICAFDHDVWTLDLASLIR